jgi:hypothetical protein
MVHLKEFQTGSSGDPLTVAGTFVASGGATIAASAGTSASPSIHFSSDTNTGIFSPAADTIAFAEGGVEAMRIDSDGDVGIGTSSPGTKLDVVGNGRFAGVVDSIYTGTTAGSTLGSFRAYGTGAGVTGETSVRGILNSGSTTSSYLEFSTSNSGTFAERMRIDSSGNLGLGVTPSAWTSAFRALDFAGGGGIYSVTTSPQTAIVTNAYNDGTWKYKTSAAASLINTDAATFTFYNAASGTAGNAISWNERMRIDPSGNVVFGATTAAARLVSAGSSVTNFKALILRNGDGATGSSASIDFEASTGTQGDEAAMAGRIAGVRTGGGTSGALTFSTTNGGTLGERARITSGGALLVGATTTTSNGNLTNAGSSAAVASASSNRAWTQINTASASNNATVDAWLGRDAAGNLFGNGFLVGHFYVYVTGASGANGFSGVYSIVTTGNGTTSATLSAVSTVTRGTSPVTSIQIANDGGNGAIKLTITYINNSGVVTGGSSTVTFVGQLA